MGVAQRQSAAPFVPSGAGIDELREAASGCRGCSLYRDATQTVFGQGSPRARLMMIGEQPGDREDRQGAPFVGPAGRLLNRALEEAGLPRDSVYLTNAVKHFKFERVHGKQRIHKKPSRTEVVACWPWLAAELGVVRPEFAVCLGATAAQALLGTSFRVTAHRGELLDGPRYADDADPLVVVATVHPSSVLRAPDPEAREDAYRRLVADLGVAASAMAGW
ncbi:UdgX family uracil-DNA binding protein [Gandjariella thermophila]|uniref:Type-4 uracil-DNA glycosylase n=1 Tax=Gandjariella thermophila TaxID=1931992 RepID=A0A4D4IZE3_9PSEU|nr:UdgX family uracil-DNA binding protein [Gandjariella thermophila]GDY29715.1 uracil-DNA glycosylase [Gandjariella thermophila]